MSSVPPAARYLPMPIEASSVSTCRVPLLARAFLATYGLEMSDVMGDEDLAFGTYRYAAQELFPP